MAFNIPDTYQNTTPAEPLDQKTLNKMVWRSLFLQASFNYKNAGCRLALRYSSRS